MGSKEKKQNKVKQQKNINSGNGGAKEHEEQPKMITDKRFASAQSDPRFMEAPKRRSKVEIDSRFNRLFTDRGFASSKASIDKRGKPKNNEKNKGASSLSHIYSLKQEDEGKKTVIEEEDTDDDDARHTETESQSESESDKLKTTVEDEEDDDGQSFDDMSTIDTTDSDSEYSEEADEEGDEFMLQEENVPDIDKETRRLAVVNMDWSHMGAVDIYVLLNSFLPKGGQIMSVAVYPTEFGLERMEEEAVRGPVGLFDDEMEKKHDSEDEDDEIDDKKLRAYELSRLRYYYAVVECDSIATADYLYKTCDGVEFERSANKLDLRFIPDSMDFKHKPRDVATEAPVGYEGLDFQTRALQHSNVHLAWDEDEPQRTKTLKRITNSDQPAESELNEILAPDDSESDSDEEDHADVMEDKSVKKRKRQEKYLALIQSKDGSDEDVEEDNEQDMEVTFNSGLEDLSKRLMEKKDKKSETVWDANLRKRKEKKRARKNRSKNSSDEESSDTDQEQGEQPDDFFVEEPDQVVHSTKRGSIDREISQEAAASRAELELLLADDNGTDTTNLKGFNLKPKKNKGRKGKEDSDNGNLPPLGLDDSRFSSKLSNPLFALDPTDPRFKRSATHARQAAQKQKIGDHEYVTEMDKCETGNKDDGLVQTKERDEISLTISSIKMKLKQNQGRLGHKVKTPK